MVQAHQLTHQPVVNMINIYIQAVAEVWPPFWFIVMGSLGGVFGSFLNAMLYRLPRGINISKPPSSCPNCNNQLRTKDLIPLFSYVFLCGKCNYCKWPVPIRYLLVELLCVILGLVSAWFYPSLFMFVLLAALISSTFFVMAFLCERHAAYKVLLFSIIMWLILLVFG